MLLIFIAVDFISGKDSLSVDKGPYSQATSNIRNILLYLIANLILAEKHEKTYDYAKAMPDKPKNKMRERDAFTVNIGRE